MGWFETPVIFAELIFQKNASWAIFHECLFTHYGADIDFRLFETEGIFKIYFYQLSFNIIG